MDSRNQRTCGFTLVELCTVMAVFSILAALAAPSLADMRRRAGALAAYHTATSTLALARSQAIARGHAVTLCPSSDNRTCTGGLDWHAGWIVYLDRRRGDQPASTADVIESVAGLNNGLVLRSSAGRTRIRYLPHGWAAGSNVRLSLCTYREPRLLGSVIVNNAGRARVEKAVAALPCPGA